MGAPTDTDEAVDAETEAVGFGADPSAPVPLPEGMTLLDSSELNPLTMAAAMAEAGFSQSPAAVEAPEEGAAEVPIHDETLAADTILLPGGYVDKEGVVHRQVVLRELNGEDEETYARAANSANRARPMEVLMERGVVSIGPYRVKDDPAMLDSLVTGDRDAIVVGLRKLTYGNTIKASIDCVCGTTSKIEIDLDADIPVKDLPWDASEVWHEVGLRREGAFAVVRLATGADQRLCFSLPDTAILAEINTVLLAETVREYAGVILNRSRDGARKISMADRQTLLEWLSVNQPGPQYTDVTHTCDVCRREVPLGLTAADIFPL